MNSTTPRDEVSPATGPRHVAQSSDDDLPAQPLRLRRIHTLCIARSRQRDEATQGVEPNHTSRASENDESKEQEDEAKTEEPGVKKRAQILKQSALKASNALPQIADHVILAKEKDFQDFFYITNTPGATLKAIRHLEIHLDIKALDEYAAYRLALALGELHPRSDGQNPHQLHTVQLVVNGKILFTRYSYQLVSPTTSDLDGQNLDRFLKGGLTTEERSLLGFKLNSTETVVAKALLSIRGVTQVLITGKGKMEGCFAETLKATLIQPPGTDINEVDDPALPYSTFALNGTGTIESEAYLQARHRVSVPTRYDFSTLKARSRWVVDERVQLLRHFLNQSEVIPRPVRSSTTARLGRKTLREFDVSFGADSSTNSRKRRRGGEEGLRLCDMIKIRPTFEQERAQEKEANERLWFQDPRIEEVELGWKI